MLNVNRLQLFQSSFSSRNRNVAPPIRNVFLVSHGAEELLHFKTLSVQEKLFHHFSRDLILTTTSILLHQYANASRSLEEVPAVPSGQSSEQTVAVKDSDKASEMARTSPTSASFNLPSPPTFETEIKRLSIQCPVNRNGDISKC